jgi:hypothetical protein
MKEIYNKKETISSIFVIKVINHTQLFRIYLYHYILFFKLGHIQYEIIILTTLTLIEEKK